jgi:hypothetical protein
MRILLYAVITLKILSYLFISGFSLLGDLNDILCVYLSNRVTFLLNFEVCHFYCTITIMLKYRFPFINFERQII